MDGTGDAWMGAKTDKMHDVQIGCTDDAWTGAMTDVSHELWLGCMDDAWTGAMTDVSHELWMGCIDDAWTCALKGIMYNVLIVDDFTSFHAGNLPHFLPINTGEFQWVCSRR